jgi:hypothetical protein
MIKITAPYQLPGYKTLELVVESEPIFSSKYYDPTNIPESSNPVMAEERTTPELGSNDHLVFLYKIWVWMWMRMRKSKSGT